MEAPADDLTPDQIRLWTPTGVENLLNAWRELFPEFVGSIDPRRFLGRALNPQQSGWVFEHWVCSAFRMIAAEATASEDRSRSGWRWR